MTKKMQKFVFSSILLGLAANTHATLITQILDSSGGTHTQDWNLAANWSDGNATAVGNTYTTATGLVTSTVTDGPGSFAPSFTDSIRSTDTAPNTFGGASLTVVGNTRLLMKATAGHVISVNLIANDQSAIDFSGAGNLQGTLQVGTGNIYLYEQAAGGAVVNSTVTGTGTLNVGSNGSTATPLAIALGANLNGFNGTISFSGAGVSTYSMASWNDPNASMVFSSGLNAANTFTSTSNLSVGALSIKGTVIPGGTYTGAQLDTLSSSTFFATDTSTITVAPEPATLGLLGAAGLGLLLRRRRNA